MAYSHYLHVSIEMCIRDSPYTIQDYYDDLYNGIWKNTIENKKLSANDRMLQRLATRAFMQGAIRIVEGKVPLFNAYAPSLDEIIDYRLDPSGKMCIRDRPRGSC